MQGVTNSRWSNLKIVLIFLLVMFIAYLPVSSFMFFIKNDAFTGYFPMKFFMSESIGAGYLPLWNPYINYGIPQYGDMSGGYWNTLTWLIASTVGYNAWTFTIEILCYLLASGIGMYRLTRKIIPIKKVAIIAGIAYMCCGYNVGHLQHINWLSGAACLPWCIWAYTNLHDRLNLKTLLTAAFCFYLLLSSAHPGIIIPAFYFFLAIAIYFFINRRNEEKISNRLVHFTKIHLFLLLSLGLLSTGLITAYLDFIPQFNRGEKIDLETSLLLPTTFQSWISFLLPFASVKNSDFFATDISMRNLYFSLTLLLLFLSFLVNKKQRWQWFLFAIGIVFLLLSTGGIFKQFAYNFIPFIGYVRLNGEFRIFSILCFVILGSSELYNYINGDRQVDKRFFIVYYVIEVLLVGAIIWGVVKSFSTGDTFLSKLPAIVDQPGMSSKFKMLIDSISFYDTLWIQGSIQLLILWSLKWCLKNRSYYLLVRIVIIDLILATLLNIPFTGAGKASVADLQNIYARSPAGIPAPSLIPIKFNDSLSTEESGMVGPWSFYNKQPGVTREAPYPIKLKTIANYLEDLDNKKDSSLIAQRLVFVENERGIDNDSAQTKIIAFNPNSIIANVEGKTEGRLVIQQSVYPRWEVFIDGEKKEWQPYRNIFLSVPITGSEKEVEFRFSYSALKIAMVISLIALIIYLVVIFIPTRKPLKN